MEKMFIAVLLLSLAAAGCAPAVVGGGAAGAYKVGTDQRTMGEIWDDSTITAKVKTALIDARAVKARKIDVDTVEGVVTLSGVVETADEVEQAVEIAASVPGVKRVTNNLNVGSLSVGRAIDDKVIGGRIKTKLIAEPGIRSLNIDVDVYDGVVTLTGIVADQEKKNRVIEIARNAGGVVKVIDNLKVGGEQ